MPRRAGGCSPARVLTLPEISTEIGASEWSGSASGTMLPSKVTKRLPLALELGLDQGGRGPEKRHCYGNNESEHLRFAHEARSVPPFLSTRHGNADRVTQRRNLVDLPRSSFEDHGDHVLVSIGTVEERKSPTSFDSKGSDRAAERVSAFICGQLPVARPAIEIA